MLSFHKNKVKILLAAALCVLLLCGCSGKKVKFPSGYSWPLNAEEISAVLTAEEIPLLDEFTQLRVADLTGSTCYEEILAWADAHPDTEVRYMVPLPNGVDVESAAAQLEAGDFDMDDSQLQEALPLLRYLPNLTSVQLGSGCSPERALEYVTAYPGIDFRYSFTLLGRAMDRGVQSLDLRSVGHAEVKELLRYFPLMAKLKTVDLGSDEDEGGFTWDDIYALHEACPGAAFSYDFTLFGKSFSLSDSEMDLNHIKMDDEGALVLKAASCMPNLRYLDMDFCGVSDESMAAIRDALPNTEVVWRIWFGDAYSVRTNVEMILASNPGAGGELNYENTRSLKYCTKVKYLDLGHNTYLSSIDFVSCMPDLEVAILAMGRWWDARPLADCPKLEYLEIQTSALNNLHPLSELKNLRHLNISYCFALHDISPIYDLDLERLWIGRYTPITEEQVAEMQRRHPDLEINTTTEDPTEGSWRYGERTEWGSLTVQPRYALLREQFGYDAQPYAYYWNDPLYFPHN